MIRRNCLALSMCMLATLVASSFLPAHVQANGGADLQTASAKEQLKSLHWIQGTWGKTDGEDVLDEVWSAPSGDSMMGVFRWTKSGKVSLFELLTITIDDGRLVFRFRHFSREQVPWEGKDDALTFYLKNIKQDEVVFENPKQDDMNRFMFRRVGSDKLLVRVEGHHEGKPPSVMEFLYKRGK